MEKEKIKSFKQEKKIFPININYFTFDLLANKFCLYECDVTGCWIVFLGDLKIVILLNGNAH